MRPQYVLIVLSLCFIGLLVTLLLWHISKEENRGR